MGSPLLLPVARFEATYWTGRETGLRSDHRPLTPILEAEDRLVIHLADLDGLSDTQIAVILGVCGL